MTKPDYVTDEQIAYLHKVGTQYMPHRHATIAAHMAKRFACSSEDAEAAIWYWLKTREANVK